MTSIGARRGVVQQIPSTLSLNVAGLAAESATKVYSIFTGGITTPHGLSNALRIIRLALTSQFVSQPLNTTQAKAHAAEFGKIIEAVVRDVASHPDVVTDAGGINANSAAAVYGRAVLLLRQGRNADLFSGGIMEDLVQLVSVSWACRVNAPTDSDGNVTFPSVLNAMEFDTRYYPGAIIDPLRRIQDTYDRLNAFHSVKHSAAVAYLENALAGEHTAHSAHLPRGGTVVGSGPNARFEIGVNSYLGHIQSVVPLLRTIEITADGARDTLTLGEIRRESRPLRAGVQAPPINSLIVLTSQSMRNVLSSALQMSLATGDVVQVPDPNAKSKNAPKQTILHIKEDSAFMEIIKIINAYKRVYNLYARKDYEQIVAHAAQHNLTPPDYLSLDYYTKNITRSGNHYVFESSSVVTELETRLRIADYTNNDVAEGPRNTGRGVHSAIPAPNLTHFLRRAGDLEAAIAHLTHQPIPRAVTDYADYPGHGAPGLPPSESLKLALQHVCRADVVGRIDRLRAQSPDFASFMSRLNLYHRLVNETMNTIVTIHFGKTISDAAYTASTASATLNDTRFKYIR